MRMEAVQTLGRILSGLLGRRGTIIETILSELDKASSDGLMQRAS